MAVELIYISSLVIVVVVVDSGDRDVAGEWKGCDYYGRRYWYSRRYYYY